MKKILLFLLFATPLFCCAQTLSQKADAKIDSILKIDRHVGLAVAVVQNGEIVYVNQFGVKNIETGQKISRDDLFRIASISKTFTSSAIMQLCEQGKFALDDDVSDALGFTVRNPAFPDKKITYRMLLSHTSSLSDAAGYFNFDIIKSTKNADYKKCFWNYAPATKYNYCNLGYNLLGALIEIHSGERYDNYIRRHILLPLGITNAGFNVDSLDNSKFVTLYNLRNSAWEASPEAYQSRAKEMENYKLGYSTPLFSPTGGMKISAVDLAKWAICRMNYGTFGNVKILNAETMKTMYTPVSTNGGEAYGLGTSIVSNLVEGETLIGHTGYAYGLRSAMFVVPDKKFGIAMMTNGCELELLKHDETKLLCDVVNAMYEVFGK